MAEKDKEGTILKSILEYGGVVIILGIVLIFIISSSIRSFKKIDDKTYVDTLHISKINFFEISSKKKDTNFIVMDKKIINDLKLTTDSINSKIKEINKASVETKKIQKENYEEYRLLLTLIGSVFAIVGFFGFKSIHDTRQMAIESVKVKAEEVAKKITESKVEEYVKQNTNEIVEKYLKNEGNLIIEKHSKDTAKSIAYGQAEEVAKATASEEFKRLRTGYDEAKKALNEDLDSIERDRKMLLRRIQDLEEHIFSKKIFKDENDIDNDDENDNPLTVI